MVFSDGVLCQLMGM